MNNLFCTAINCIYNYNNKCTANYIVVNKSNTVSQNETMCETFSNKGLRDVLNNINSMNILDYYDNAVNTSSGYVDINCSVKECIYNKNNKCTASNVKIHGQVAYTKDGTFCETFTK